METLKKVYKALKEAQTKLKTLEQSACEPIAIIGMACRFPGGANRLEDYWRVIRDGIDATSQIPPDRWDVERYYDPNPEAFGKMYTKRGGFLDCDIRSFDHQFFQISPLEAKSLDPQQRLLLEVSHEALEDSGLDIPSLKGSKVGVYIGVINNDYSSAHWRSGDPEKISGYAITGNAFSVAAGRISYRYGFQGPSMAIDTACSSSLLSAHLACQSLRRRESDMALIGGVNLILTPETHIGFCRLRSLSPDGRCKPFDADADGLGRGEGCGIVLLKRVSDAQRDRDRIWAVIRGGAVNQDGKSNGLTAPNGVAQRQVIRAALKDSGLTPNEIDYIETHGTGTSLGDPIEIDALNQVFGQDRDKDHPLRVGSVKANISHLESAAGIASLIKAALMLTHRQLPPLINFQRPNPQIDWERTRIRIADKLTDLQDEAAYRIGVSSFGFSGTNVFMTLEHPPQPSDLDSGDPDGSKDKKSLFLLPISAGSEPALSDTTLRYGDFLSETHENLRDVCYTAGVSRARLPNRLAITATSTEDAAQALTMYRQEGRHPRVASKRRSLDNDRIVFLFTGQGSQYHRMAEDLYHSDSVFQETIHRCNDLLKPLMKPRLIDLLYGVGSEEMIHQTVYTQPVIFSVEYALAKMWESWGVAPSVVMGHSIGEYVAACLARVFSLEHGLKLVAARGQLMQSLPDNGAMAVVVARPERVEHVIQSYSERISIAAVNAPENTVVSGDQEAIEEMRMRFAEDNIPSQPLRISQGIHSHLMDPILERFQAIAEEIDYSSPKIPIVSNATGRIIHEDSGGKVDSMTQPEYWTRHIRGPVRFYESIKTLDQAGYQIFLEAGATSTLISLGLQCAPDNRGLWLPTLGVNNSLYNMRPYKIDGRSDWESVLSAVGQLYAHGIDMDWTRVQPTGRKISLPTYPFQRERHWMEPFGREVPPEDASSESHKKVQLEKRSMEMKKESIDQSNVIKEMARLLEDASGVKIREELFDTNLLELGLDSLMLTRLRNEIKHTFGVELEISLFFQETDTFTKIADYINRHAPKSRITEKSSMSQGDREAGDFLQPSGVLPSRSPISDKNRGMVDLFSQQLQLMENQLEILRSTGEKPALDPRSRPLPAHDARASARRGQKLRAMRIEPDELTPNQAGFIRDFTERYTSKTTRSKKYIDQYRPLFSDWINSLNFRHSLKEIIYPIVSDRAAGSRIWDIDGNEYIDLAMGYGVNLFGNSPPFINQALSRQLERGYGLGPQSDLTGPVAKLIHELTGVERVAFCNTGSEAVMVALRLARSVTGRDKIALFSGSYHGTFDGVLAEASPAGIEFGSVPGASGTSPHMVENVLTLNYGTDQALEMIRRHSGELAAVLTEPVQSRNPSLQPKKFLRELRGITQESGVALIFDEVLTGFRVHPGGSQAWFGVQSDIVTYGKVVGGGMPIGIVAGSAQYLDAIDGGVWRFGDDSFPDKEVSAFAGTFCKHPLTMAAAQASLLRLKQGGEALQESINARTKRLADLLNRFFQEENIPIQMHYFGSVFRLESYGKYSQILQPIEMELFFRLLLEKGVYTWERRVCFLSTAHTDDDVHTIFEKVREAIHEMREVGFWDESGKSISPQLGQSETASVKEVEKKMGQKSQTLPDDASKEALDSSDDTKIKKISLTDAQKQLFFLTKLNENAKGAYTESVAIKLRGQIYHHRFQEAVDRLIERHDSLRAEIDKDGQTLIIYPFVRVPVAQIELDGKRKKEDWLSENSQRQFDLHCAPLIRISLLQLNRNESLLVINVHHIVVDGISISLIFRDLCRLYNAAVDGNPLTLDPSPKPIDFLRQQRSYLKSDQYQTDENYWLAQFPDGFSAVDFPTDFSRTPMFTFKGARYQPLIQGWLYHQIKEFSKAQRSTSFMVLLAAYTLLIHRLSGSERVTIAFPVSGRDFDNGEAMVGYCAHLMLFHSHIDLDEPFVNYLNRVKKQLSTSYHHQQYPFSSLSKKLKLQNFSHGSGIPFSFNLDRLTGFPKMTGLEIEYETLPLSQAKYDLNLDVLEIKESLLFKFEYATDLFKSGTIRRIATNLLTLLSSVISHPECPVGKTAIMTRAQRIRIINEWNETDFELPDKCCHQLFEEQVERTPGNIAAQFQDRKITYGELNGRANRLAGYLIDKHRVKSDTIITLLAERNINFLITVLAIFKAGGSYQPLDPLSPPARIRQILQESQPDFVLCSTTFRSLLLESLDDMDDPPDLFYLQDMFKPGQTGANLTPRSTLDHLAYIIYTSGSTGVPKGAMVEQGNMVNHIHAKIKDLQLTAEDVVAQNGMQSFDVSVWQFLAPLLVGAKTYIFSDEEARDPALLLTAASQARITVLEVVPTMLRMMLDELDKRPHYNLSRLRWIIPTGEPLSPELCRRWFAHFPKIPMLNVYGPSECGDNVTHCRIDQPPATEVVNMSIGRPTINNKIYILDKLMQPVPIGVTGEIHISGANVGRGYLNNPKRTEQAFLPNSFGDGPLYKTGDLARYRMDGEIEFLSRADFQVKIRGFRIELGEIEARMLNFSSVRECVVTAKKDHKGDNHLAAYVVFRPTARRESVIVEELRAFLGKWIPEFMIPAYIVPLSQMPLTRTGKIDRKRLPNPEDQDIVLASKYVAPRTDLEKRIAQIWQEVIGREKVGIHDNYLALGGDSIKAVQIASRLRQTKSPQEKGIVIKLRDLFRFPTVSKFSAHIAKSDDREKKHETSETTPDQLTYNGLDQDDLDQIFGG